jgi:DNA-binding NtrC family response regulator
VAQLKVLVVDDDDSVRAYLHELLAPDGCEVVSVDDPTQVLDTLQSDRFHIVTLDLMMPRMGGLELLHAIRRVDRDVAVIILTGFPSLETATEAIDLDVSAYMQKPFSGEELRETISRVARKKGIIVRREDELHITIGQNIRLLRKQHSLTLKEMGRRCNLSVSQLSQIERAESSPSVSSLYKVASALGVKISDLLGEF